MSKRDRGRRIAGVAALSVAAVALVGPAGPSRAGASGSVAETPEPGPSLAVFDGFAASQSVFMEPRSNAVFALPANQLIGATHAEINSQPRAQGYAATWGVPLAQNARGVGIPVDYYGQCYANYPGEARVECGIPFSKDPAPAPPSGGGFSGSAFKAHAEASGTSGSPQTTRASGITEAGGMTAGEAFRIGWNRSESASYVEDGVLHAVTSSVAQDITIGGVLHIGSVEARAKAVHPGTRAEATGEAATVMQNVTIAGAPVTIGPAGVLVQGQPIGQAPAPAAKPILDAMASQGMTIEPLPAPRLSRDEGTGLVEAASDGFRVLLQSPNGDAKLELVLGRALARAGAVLAADDTPFDLSAGLDEPVAAPPADGPVAAPPVRAAGTASPAGPPAVSPPEGDAAPAGVGTAGAFRRTGGFTAFDPVAGSVAPAAEPERSGDTGLPAAIPPIGPGAAPVTAQPAALAHDLSSRVLTVYAAMFGVVLAGLTFALGRRPRRFKGSA